MLYYLPVGSAVAKETKSLMKSSNEDIRKFDNNQEFSQKKYAETKVSFLIGFIMVTSLPPLLWKKRI